MKKIFFIICIVFCTLLNGQKVDNDKYVKIDKLALLIPDSLSYTTDDIANYISATFQTDKDKLRAIFKWITYNIQYDIDNIYAINFYESKDDKVLKVITNRKGICENYAALFENIALKLGIRTYIIEGYTKQRGFVDYIPHAWCASFIDSSWVIIDPTWGSGYVSNGKFQKKINNKYFMMDPSESIKSHMPFDYLWQFLNYPITAQEFYEGTTFLNKEKSFFNFNDSIYFHERQDSLDQLISTAERIEKNGLRNSLIFNRLQQIKLQIENDKQQKMIDLYNLAVADYNAGLGYLNEYIQYFNKQFTPKRTDAQIMNMVNIADDKFIEAREKLKKVEGNFSNISSAKMQLLQSIEDAEKQIREQRNWLETYFSKGKINRKSMFYKYTWFGIPLN